MKDFEDELRDVLRREEPPRGFAKRLLRRTGDERPRAWRSPVWMWAAAAAVAIAMGGGIQYRQVQQAREERARGEAAAQQVRDALRITGSKLHIVQTKVKEMGL
jgi:hypothetical protein